MLIFAFFLIIYIALVHRVIFSEDFSKYAL